jgi:hypothetical protein
MFGSNYRLIPTGPDPLHNWDFLFQKKKSYL